MDGLGLGSSVAWRMLLVVVDGEEADAGHGAGITECAGGDALPASRKGLDAPGLGAVIAQADQAGPGLEQARRCERVCVVEPLRKWRVHDDAIEVPERARTGEVEEVALLEGTCAALLVEMAAAVGGLLDRHDIDAGRIAGDGVQDAAQACAGL